MCHTVLLGVTYSWACNIDIGNVNAVAFLDLIRKRLIFDTVDQILVSKLHLYIGYHDQVLSIKVFSPFFT